MMLGRKQSLKGEPVLADYGPEESLNESADIEWVNMVNIMFVGLFVLYEQMFQVIFLYNKLNIFLKF